jgi:hypothetical protein
MAAAIPSSVGKGRGFGGLQIDDLADQHRSAQMRDDEPHAVACFVINSAVTLMTKDSEQCHARGRLLQHPRQPVYDALRPEPLLVKTRLKELVVGH